MTPPVEIVQSVVLVRPKREMVRSHARFDVAHMANDLIGGNRPDPQHVGQSMRRYRGATAASKRNLAVGIDDLTTSSVEQPAAIGLQYVAFQQTQATRWFLARQGTESPSPNTGLVAHHSEGVATGLADTLNSERAAGQATELSSTSVALDLAAMYLKLLSAGRARPSRVVPMFRFHTALAGAVLPCVAIGQLRRPTKEPQAAVDTAEPDLLNRHLGNCQAHSQRHRMLNSCNPVAGGMA